MKQNRLLKIYLTAALLGLAAAIPTNAQTSASIEKSWSISAGNSGGLHPFVNRYSLDSDGTLIEKRGKEAKTIHIDEISTREIGTLLRELKLPAARTKIVKGLKIYDGIYGGLAITVDGKRYKIDGTSFGDEKHVVLTGARKTTLDKLKRKLTEIRAPIEDKPETVSPKEPARGASSNYATPPNNADLPKETRDALKAAIEHSSFARIEKTKGVDRTINYSYTMTDTNKCLIHLKSEFRFTNAHKVFKQVSVVSEAEIPLSDIDISSIKTYITPMFSYENGKAEKADPEYSISFEAIDGRNIIKTEESTAWLDDKGEVAHITGTDGNKEEATKTSMDSSYGLRANDELTADKLGDLFKTAVKFCAAPSNR